MSKTEEPRVKVAIVGSGLAGQATAYLLQQHPRRYETKIFESGASFSLDSASVSIPNASRTASDRVDLPMRAFAGGYYNNLKGLYDHLGIKYRSQPFLFEFARALLGPRGDQDSSYFIHASNLHQMPPPRPSGVTTLSYWIEVIYVLACYAWFSICCFFIAPRDVDGVAETLEDYLRRTWLPEYFTTYYVLPLISSVTTCPHESLLAFPAIDLVEYKRRTHGAPHFTVLNGVKAVQEKLMKGVRYELSAFVSSVEPLEGGVRLSWQQAGSDVTQAEVFDKVVLAVAPDVVGAIFEPLRRHMAMIPTTVVKSVVHTDESTLPTLKAQGTEGSALSQLIYLRTSTASSHQTESLHVQSCGAVVTTCPFSPIKPSKVIHSAKFTRVLRSPESRRIVNSIFKGDQQFHGDEKCRVNWRNGDDNVWIVGGWCWDGMVLLEGCVVSAMRVAQALGASVPWR